MARWLIVRHGQTDWNARGLLQGHTDVPLNQVGRDQADRLGKRLSAVEIDAAYCSDLARCTQTLEVALGAREVSVSFSQQLREQAYGRWEGKSFLEIEAAEPDLYAEMISGYNTFTPPEGESFRQVEARVTSFAEETRDRHPSGALLIVGHGAALRALIASMVGLPLEMSWRFRLESCSLTILDVGADAAVLELLNDTSHLGRDT